ncbi:MAG: hypothetical protein Q9213_007926 [Squamulea squamosa]
MSRSVEFLTPLCDTCTGLDITVEKFVISPDNPDPASNTLHLGTLHQVRSRLECVLCTFMAEHFKDFLGVEEQQAHRMNCRLRWRPYGWSTSDKMPTVNKARQLSIYAETDLRETTPEILLSLLAEDAPEPDFHGLRIKEEQVDFKRIKAWLTSCISWHGAKCEKPVMEDLSPPWDIPNIRLIDVEQMCLVRMVKGCQFVTLSYVWGSVPTLMATNENITRLEKPGELQRLAPEISNTVRDAIHLTAKIGQRFLWIDRLCIIQDNQVHLQAHIWNMERIYGGSILLIIAADGDNAESGLPGVRPGTRNHQQTLLPVKSTIRLVTTQHLEALRDTTTYQRRGWTLQEEFFARRKLIIIGGQAFFECRNARWQEDVFLENPMIRTMDISRGRLLPPDEGRSIFVAYDQILRDYMSRQLTNECDTLDAFAGISNYWAEQFGATMKYGLPNSAFDWALLWEPQQPMRRRDLDDQTFPSWSWAGWKGCVGIHPSTGDLRPTPEKMQQWLTHHTWIVWYQWSPGLTALLWDHIHERKNKDWRDRAHIGYRCFNTVDPFGRSKNRFVIDGKSQEEMSRSRRGNEGLDARDSLSAQRAILGQLLLFWTVSAKFHVEQMSKQQQARLKAGAFAVIDRRGVASGYVIPDCGLPALQPAVVDNINEVELILLSDAPSTSVTDDEQYEKAVKDAEAQEDLTTESKPMAIIDSGPQMCDGKIWNLYNVMLIDRQKQGTVRSGIGKIYKGAVQYALDPGPLWKPVVLG